ncbi:MAG TPA: response regulator, partial [Spirochaetia bacterium]|nr:response regulator [Spirochaetia bacterium]
AHLGFQAVLAGDGRQALSSFLLHRESIVCVIVDLTMPAMDGEETFREIHRIDPRIPVILSSGYNEQEAVQRFVGKGLAGFLQKPYQLSQLRNKLREILEARRQCPG